ncbi:MAG: molybdopterin-dependent oxidoreductase [Proteobacteria bacterium]|nr:molybdopterin-dependent oxidoreductase [Pseudomonadota bacterium]
MSFKELKPSDVTPEALYLDRRKFLETSIYAGTGLATLGGYRYFRGGRSKDTESVAVATKQLNHETSTPLDDVTNYNNFYEFSTDKEAVASAAQHWNISEWKLEISGLVENSFVLNLKDIGNLASEERIYRFRCVEGWSMIILGLNHQKSSHANPLSQVFSVS